MFVRIVFNSCSFWSTVETLWICLLSHSEFSFGGPTRILVCCMQYPRIRTCGWIRQISLFFVWSVCYVHGLKPPTNSTQSMMGLGLFFESGKTMLDITTPSNAQISLAQAGCGASMAGGQGGVPKAATDGEWSLVFLNLQNQVFPVLDFFKKNIDIFFETNWPNFWVSEEVGHSAFPETAPYSFFLQERALQSPRKPLVAWSDGCGMGGSISGTINRVWIGHWIVWNSWSRNTFGGWFILNGKRKSNEFCRFFCLGT